MSAKITEAADGIITLKITGLISPSILAACQAQILVYLREWGGGSILCICEGFEGWTGGDWGDLSFQVEADPLIRKMAIIGESQWEQLALAFTAKGFRPFPIGYFQTDRLVDARDWLLG